MTVKSVMGQRLLIEKYPDEETKTKTGIVTNVIDKYITEPKKGKIFLIGGDVNYELEKKGVEPLKVGDEIIYDRADYSTVKSDKVDYELITVFSIIAVI